MILLFLEQVLILPGFGNFLYDGIVSILVSDCLFDGDLGSAVARYVRDVRNGDGSVDVIGYKSLPATMSFVVTVVDFVVHKDEFHEVEYEKVCVSATSVPSKLTVRWVTAGVPKRNAQALIPLLVVKVVFRWLERELIPYAYLTQAPDG